MKNSHSPADIRNFAVVGHASSGKTLLCESMLACASVLNRLGSISAGTTASDYHEDERQHQISIHTSLLHCEWLERKFNIIDTPGYLDFISEGLGALRVGDFALVVVHAIHGPGVGTDQVWKYATQFEIPKMICVNAMDKEHVNPEAILVTLRARYGAKVFPLNIPLNPGPGFNQVLDVLRSDVVTYATDGSGKYTEAPAAGAHKERVSALHKELIELTAEADDTLMEKFFEQGSLTEEQLRAGEHAAVQKQSIIPLFFASAETNVGVARMMDFIAKYGSSPLDRERVQAQDLSGRKVDVVLNGPDPALYVFKTMTEPQFGELSYFRLYSGHVHAGMDLYNADRKCTERLGQIYVLNGRNRTAVPDLGPGDIGATVKLKDTHTGNTLCAPKRIVSLPKVSYPTPNIHASLKLKSRGEEDKMASGLAALHEEDPTFLFHVDPELHQTVISGQGELHLRIVAERLKARFKVDFEMAEPRVPYRETIQQPADSKFRHKKQTGGAGQFAEVWMRIEPRDRNSGVEFIQSLAGQNVDRNFVPSVEKGVKSAVDEGVIAGYRVVDVKIDFYDGKMHPVDSKDIAFQIAGKSAFREAFLKAKPRLLEPIFQIEVRVPEDHLGPVMGDLSSRRGHITGTDGSDGYSVVTAHVPQKELYKYASVLRSLTGGRGIHTEHFSHYQEMPRDLEQKIIADHGKTTDAE
ncbi:MAG: elongation factor [Verrucomicrobiota bacterium]|jgi:elongation factor G